MNTLPQDLVDLITNKIRTSDCLLLGIETPDNQPYLNLITLKARLKLALEQDNVGWIHQILACIKDKQQISEWTPLIPVNSKYEQILSVDKRLYDYYICGLRGDHSTINEQTDPQYRSRFAIGLAEGQHYELFDRLILSTDCVIITSNNESHMNFGHIMNFENEDYIINKMKSLETEIQIHSGYYLSVVINLALMSKRFKVAKYFIVRYYLSQVQLIRCNNCHAYLIHINESPQRKYEDREILKMVIYQACIDSNYAALDHIYKNTPRKLISTTFRKVLASSLITPELHQYAVHKFDPTIKLNQHIIDTIKPLRVYMDEYKYFYNHSFDAMDSNSLVNFITCALLDSYIDTNNFVKFREVYSIIMKSPLIDGTDLLKSINNYISNSAIESMFSITHDLYYNMDIQQLATIAKQKNIYHHKMRKAELIAALMKDCY